MASRSSFPPLAFFDSGTRTIPQERLVKLIGDITLNWNHVQFKVFRLFFHLTGLPVKQADAMFFALRTDSSQRDITAAAARNVITNEVLLTRCTSFLKEIGKIAGERNVVIHSMWIGWGSVERMTPSPFVSGPKLLKKDAFEKQFKVLNRQLVRLYREGDELDHRIERHVASLKKAQKRIEERKAKEQENALRNSSRNKKRQQRSSRGKSL